MSDWVLVALNAELDTGIARKTEMSTRYLKVWQGFTSGTFAGRDDGHPETKSQIIENMEQLVRTYDANAQYYKLEPVDVGKAITVLKDLGV